MIVCAKERRREFEQRRKLHYNEFEAVLRARELMEQDEDDDDDERIEIDETTPSAKWNRKFIGCKYKEIIFLDQYTSTAINYLQKQSAPLTMNQKKLTSVCYTTNSFLI